ncbi:MAG: DUF3726 domain-containing protein [Pseudomonadota bacterium]
MSGLAGGEVTRYSLSEIDAQCRRAARGAGCSWGIAEEAGKAARWLSAHDLPGPEAVAALLRAPRDCPCGGGTGPACALRLGAACSDHARAIAAGEAVEAEVAQPLMVVAMMARAAAACGAAFALDWEGIRARCGPSGVAIEGAGPLLAGRARLRVAAGDAPDGVRPQIPVSRPVAPGTWAILDGHAARTYAPATALSRRLGAGSGNAD